MNVYGVFMLYNGERTLEGLFHNKYRAEYFMSDQEDFDSRCFYENRTYYIEDLFIDMRGE